MPSSRATPVSYTHLDVYKRQAPDKATGIGAYYQGLHGVTTYGMYSDTKAYVKAVSAQERKFAQ